MNWFTSYLTVPWQNVRCVSALLTSSVVKTGVGPLAILFLFYNVNLQQLIECYSLHSHGFADDTQSTASAHSRTRQHSNIRCPPASTTPLSGCRATDSISTQTRWKCCGVQQVKDKTRFLVRIGQEFITQAVSVRNLAIFFDSDWSWA